MSDNTRQRLEVLALLLSLALGAAAFGKAWFTLPYRLDQAEATIQAAKVDRSADRELLVRIDERLQTMQRDLAEFKAAKSPNR